MHNKMTEAIKFEIAQRDQELPRIGLPRGWFFSFIAATVLLLLAGFGQGVGPLRARSNNERP